ncbi:MAG: hypothetical protein R3C01_01195 [Planctomycetaceae bacterium]
MAAKLVGSVFFTFGIVCLVFIAMDTYKKVVASGFSVVPHAAVSVLIVSVMAGVPGLLFGFQTNRICMSRDLNEIVITVDFILFWKNRQLVADEFNKVKLKPRKDTSYSKVGSSTQYRTRTVHYFDIVLTGPGGKFEVLDSVHEADEACARQVATEIADYLQISFDETI